MLEIDDTVLVIIDVQGTLAHLMYDKKALFAGLIRIIKGAKALGLPILWVEQNPKRLGPTIPEVAELLDGIEPISKLSFSCCGSDEFMTALEAASRNQILLAGIESHVCVYQTAMDLIRSGYELQVVVDAVSSRTPENKRIALDKIRDAGGHLTSVEMALFELLRVAQGDRFKEILAIVK